MLEWRNEQEVYVGGANNRKYFRELPVGG